MSPHVTHDSSTEVTAGTCIEQSFSFVGCREIEKQKGIQCGERRRRRPSRTSSPPDEHARACGVNPQQDFTTSYDFREVVLHEHFRKQTRRACLANAYAVGAYELALDAACIREKIVGRAGILETPPRRRALHSLRDWGPAGPRPRP